jgi:peptidyl-prolyl cis-trans isomerase SurA
MGSSGMKFHSVLLGAGVVLSLLFSACKSTPPPNVAAVVNKRTITNAELEKQYQSTFPTNAEGSSEDQIRTQKLELLRSLIDNEIMLQRAEKLGLMAADADVEAKLNEFKAPYTKEEFEQQLKNRKMTLEDLKSQLRQSLSIQKLINKEITSHISITDAEIANYYQANKALFNLAEPQVQLAQILVTPAPDPNVRNLKNSKARSDADAKRKIQEIEARLKRGEDFAMLAQNYSEDPNSTPNGGDLGLIPESALEKANAELRQMVMTLPPGAVSPIIRSQEGYRILKVMSKEPAGQRELTDPLVQQKIRETLLNRKDQLLKAAYYEVARNETKVVNNLARSIVESAGTSAKQ